MPPSNISQWPMIPRGCSCNCRPLATTAGARAVRTDGTGHCSLPSGDREKAHTEAQRRVHLCASVSLCEPKGWPVSRMNSKIAALKRSDASKITASAARGITCRRASGSARATERAKRTGTKGSRSPTSTRAGRRTRAAVPKRSWCLAFH